MRQVAACCLIFLIIFTLRKAYNADVFCKNQKDKFVECFSEMQDLPPQAFNMLAAHGVSFLNSSADQKDDDFI